LPLPSRLMDIYIEHQSIMTIKNKLLLSCSLIGLLLLNTDTPLLAQSMIKDKKVDHSIHVAGAMSNVMQKGDLSNTINIDTIADKQYLCGLGPLENLSGEILILDGKGYKSTVVNEHEMQVTSTWSMKAPFFVYTHVEHWQDVFLPDSITALPQLEHFIDQITQKFPRPFCFRVMAKVDSAAIHVVNLPAGTKVCTPEQAHTAGQEYILRNQTVTLIGFFSTEHQGIFTHHDSFVHIHLITEDRKQMGHLDSIKFKKGTRLLLPIL